MAIKQSWQFDERHHLAVRYLNLSADELENAYQGELGQTHKKSLESGIKHELLTAEDKDFITQLNAYIANGWRQEKIIQHFLAATLYCHPHQLPSRWFENAEVPQWLLNDFVAFMFETPSFFQDLGEADAYYRYIKDWVDFLHQAITTAIDDPFWQEIAWIFTQRANFIPTIPGQL